MTIAKTGVYRAAVTSTMAVALSLMITAGSATAEGAADLLPQKYRDAGVIQLVTDAQYRPFQYINEDGEMVGFEVDLWDAIAERLGVEMEVTSVSFDSMIPGVQSGRWDVAMEGITDNPVRREVVSFVNYGYTTSSAYVLEKNSDGIEDHLDLCGMNGAAQSGTEWVDMIAETLSVACVAAGQEAMTVSEYSTSNDVLLSLYSGRADFVLTSAASAREIMNNAPHPVSVVSVDILPRQPSGIAFRPDEMDLGEAILEALREIMADGTYEEIYTEWDVTPMMMTHEPGINSETIPVN
ncbi:ABC transporter substrate-binding protein [Leisingera daeponensis]|uniref:ABC transporter substrate-binding protein n=1 Tax=Leisingera daeponensis TaxID=405746 RepID=UPI001C978791|nr:ABC transporter substrate-binding protein [Leisingera daeponensis]MBY6058583.1 ABC transporter substrate-binding protein [Leisingera daeponensis]